MRATEAKTRVVRSVRVDACSCVSVKFWWKVMNFEISCHEFLKVAVLSNGYYTSNTSLKSMFCMNNFGRNDSESRICGFWRDVRLLREGLWVIAGVIPQISVCGFLVYIMVLTCLGHYLVHIKVNLRSSVHYTTRLYCMRNLLANWPYRLYIAGLLSLYGDWPRPVVLQGDSGHVCLEFYQLFHPFGILTPSVGFVKMRIKRKST